MPAADRSATAGVVAGLDLGTSGLKGVLLDRRGTVVAHAQAAYPTRRPEPGAAEQDALGWLTALRTVVAELRAACSERWLGVGLSAMMPTLVTVDAAGEPVGPALTWEDARADADGERLAAAVGAQRLYEATGQRVDGRYLLPMFARLARVEPQRVAATYAVLSAKDFLFGRLTGHWVTDPSTAAGFGAYDLACGSWSAQVLDCAGVDARLLPRIHDATTTYPLTSAAAAVMGLPTGLPVAVGGADSVLGAFGAGLRETGEIAYLTGTSTVVLGVSADAAIDPQGRYLVTPLAGLAGWGLEMDLLATGSAWAWLAELTGRSVPDIAGLAGTVPPEQAPVLLPYLAPGEQGALWNPALAGSAFGLTLAHGPAHLARALQTGIVLESRRCLAVLAERTGQATAPVHAAGAAGAALAADLADATGRPVHVTRPATSAIGAALLLEDVERDATRTAGPPVLPQPGGSARWAALAARHDAALATVLSHYRPDQEQLP